MEIDGQLTSPAKRNGLECFGSGELEWQVINFLLRGNLNDRFCFLFLTKDMETHEYHTLC